MARRPTVLIVDDESDIREMLRQILERRGYGTTIASNAGDALSHLRDAAPPDLILADLAMPGITVAEFRDRLLAEPTLSEVPLVLLTGDPKGAATALALGAAGHLAKPVELSDLLTTVRLHCGPGA